MRKRAAALGYSAKSDVALMRVSLAEKINIYIAEKRYKPTTSSRGSYGTEVAEGEVFGVVRDDHVESLLHNVVRRPDLPPTGTRFAISFSATPVRFRVSTGTRARPRGSPQHFSTVTRLVHVRRRLLTGLVQVARSMAVASGSAKNSGRSTCEKRKKAKLGFKKNIKK